MVRTGDQFTTYFDQVSLVAVFLPLTAAQQRMRVALRDRHELVLCDDWTAVLRTCAERFVRTVVIDLYATGTPEFERLRQLRARHPRTTIVLYVSMALGRTLDLFEAARIGADALVILDENDAARTLLGQIERAESRSLSGIVVRSLRPSTDPLVKEALLLAVARAHEHVSTAMLARLLAVRPSTLRDRLAAAGFPPARRLLTWARLIAAAHALEDERSSADRVATALGFASGSAFRNICQRYVHATPTEIRSRGGTAYVLRTLLRRVETRGKQARSNEPRVGRAGRSPAVIF